MAGPSEVVYAIECPRCGRRGWAQMVAGAVRGTYREPVRRMIARRVGCDACGYFCEVPPERGDAYRLWFRARYLGHDLWARNEVHLEFLIAWLSGPMRVDRLSFGDRAYVECLPRWMLRARRRVVERLERLRLRG